MGWDIVFLFVVVVMVLILDDRLLVGGVIYSFDIMIVGDGIWDFFKNIFLFFNLVGFNFEIMWYNGVLSFWFLECEECVDFVWMYDRYGELIFDFWLVLKYYFCVCYYWCVCFFFFCIIFCFYSVFLYWLIRLCC